LPHFSWTQHNRKYEEKVAKRKEAKDKKQMKRAQRVQSNRRYHQQKKEREGAGED
jgi:hypothetical protein